MQTQILIFLQSTSFQFNLFPKIFKMYYIVTFLQSMNYKCAFIQIYLCIKIFLSSDYSEKTSESNSIDLTYRTIIKSYKTLIKSLRLGPGVVWPRVVGTQTVARRTPAVFLYCSLPYSFKKRSYSKVKGLPRQ